MIENRLLPESETRNGKIVLVGSLKLTHMMLEFVLVITKFPVSSMAPFDTSQFSLLLDLHSSNKLGALSTSCLVSF